MDRVLLPFSPFNSSFWNFSRGKGVATATEKDADDVFVRPRDSHVMS
jgi:hypothetical protein